MLYIKYMENDARKQKMQKLWKIKRKKRRSPALAAQILSDQKATLNC